MGKNRKGKKPSGARKGATTGDGGGSNWAVGAKAREDAKATRVQLEAERARMYAQNKWAAKKRARDEDKGARRQRAGSDVLEDLASPLLGDSPEPVDLGTDGCCLHGGLLHGG